jgi:hypothetical protein
MQFRPARLFGLILFVSAPIFMFLGIINVFAVSSGLSKAVSFFEILTLGSLVILPGLFVWNALGIQMPNFGPRAAGAQPPGQPGRTQGPGPDGGFSA